ncbi:hypothetical protein [Acinetobacter pragensis]|uniref:hypothetical protein n=1 Tax=Acinetobacter pragensis TaxID=1806892 RepID=UPI0033415562
MHKTLYQALQVAFPELKEIELPDEQDNFESLMLWLNQFYSNLQQLNMMDYRQNGIAECHRLQQLNIDLDELSNQIDAEMSAFYEMYEEGDQEIDPEPAHAYDFEFTYNVVFNNIKLFIEPYDLALLVIEQESPYWLLVPNNEELVNQIITAFNEIFGNEEPMVLID